MNGTAVVRIDRTTNSLIISETKSRRVTRWPLWNGVRGAIHVSDVLCNGLAMNDGWSLHVSNQERHEVRRYRQGQTEGVVVAGEFSSKMIIQCTLEMRGIIV